MTEEVKAITVDELRKQIAEAAGSGDDGKLLALSKQLNELKRADAKKEAEAAIKEAEALAGKRGELAAQIHQLVKGLKLDVALKAVKAHGFTYKVDGAVPGEPDTVYKAVALAVPEVRKVKPGGGHGGSTGKSKDEYGMTLTEIFDKFATDADKAKLAAADSNSKQWNVKVGVKKAAIAAGLLTPAR